MKDLEILIKAHLTTLAMFMCEEGPSDSDEESHSLHALLAEYLRDIRFDECLNTKEDLDDLSHEEWGTFVQLCCLESIKKSDFNSYINYAINEYNKDRIKNDWLHCPALKELV